MTKIDGITVAFITYKPLRPFPSSTESHLEGWIKNVSGLQIAKEILIVEMLDEVDKSELPNILTQDPRIRVIHRPNDPPYADPVRPEILKEAKSDWILFMADDERLSNGMIQFLNSLLINDPAPKIDWSALQFQREDYIFYNNLWRYIPANGNDPQTVLIKRSKTDFDVNPHALPKIDGDILFLSDRNVCILHYRSYEKILNGCLRYNSMFHDMPHIVQMQTDYLKRVKHMLGVED